MYKHLPRISSVRVVLAVTSLVVVYFLVSGAFNAVRSHQLRQQADRLEDDIGQIEARYQRLEALRDYLNSDEYIESVAREQLGLVREGESGFVVVSTVPTPTPAPGEGPPQPELWWDVLIR